ncbi:MAG: hypothetical protein ACO1QS_06480 [Verrucomicrobiota bacterium]
MPVQANDQAPKTPAQPAKDPVCQASAKPGVDCHSPGSRASVLNSYLTEQGGKLATSQTTTNAVKDCDKPPSKAALMQKAAPAAK